MRKPDVREEARRTGLRLFEKPDSQEICFIPGGDYKKFLDAYLEEQGEAIPDTSGELVTTSGEVIGTHKGIHNFTVGQRKGLGVATGSPLYVLEIRGDQRQVVVGGPEDLLSRTLRAKRLNWIAIDDLREPLRVRTKIRHRHEAALVHDREDGRRRGSRNLRRASARRHSGPGWRVLRRRRSGRRRLDLLAILAPRSRRTSRT